MLCSFKGASKLRMSKQPTVFFCMLWDVALSIRFLCLRPGAVQGVALCIQTAYVFWCVTPVEGEIACLPSECSMHKKSLMHSDMMGKYAVDKMSKQHAHLVD